MDLNEAIITANNLLRNLAGKCAQHKSGGEIFVFSHTEYRQLRNKKEYEMRIHFNKKDLKAHGLFEIHGVTMSLSYEEFLNNWNIIQC